jgi:hypothetical protein
MPTHGETLRQNKPLKTFFSLIYYLKQNTTVSVIKTVSFTSCLAKETKEPVSDMTANKDERS